MSRGSSTGDDKVFVVGPEADLEDGILRIPIFASDFNRFRFKPSGKFRVIFPYEVGDMGFGFIQNTNSRRSFRKPMSTFCQSKTHSRNEKATHNGIASAPLAICRFTTAPRLSFHCWQTKACSL